MVLPLMEAPASAPEVMVRDRWVPEPFDHLLVKDGRRWQPRTRLGFTVFRALRYLPEDIAHELLDRIQSAVVIESRLALAVIRPYRGATKVEDLGIVCHKVVTDAGVNAIVDAFQNTVEIENFKFHGIGVGNASDLAEAASNTALFSELTTEYAPTNSTRATGSTTEGATANVYRTVGTNTVDAAVGIEEHGIFDQAATGGGVLLDRSTFAIVNLAIDDSLQSTYDLTLSSGG